MKKLFLLLLLCPLLTACSDDDDDSNSSETRIQVTPREIEGSWIMTTGSGSSALKYILTFADDFYTYTLNVTDATNDWVHRERGTYSISGYEIKADADVYFSSTGSTRSMVDGNEIYWTTWSSLRMLHMYPLGTFSAL